MLYAAYGSNLHPVRLGRRLPAATLLGKGVVSDRTLRFHKRGKDGSAKCDIAIGQGEVHVAVYRIDPREKARLDRIEGKGIGYIAESLNVPNYGECFTYVATDTHVDESLKPFSWYQELVLVGSEYLQFPRRYVDWIASQQSMVDPNAERHAEQMRIVHWAKRRMGLACQDSTAFGRKQPSVKE
ncbi:MAG: gamma-glutamylcyclotransferase family protein [Gammaproteobacteria bacterium]